MYKDALRAAWAEINITNLDFNIKQIKEKVGSGVKITGVVKADAYGHGSVRVATVLRANGIESFAVATLSEAVRLRKAGFLLEEIMVLSPIPEPYIDTIIEHRLSPVVCDYKNAEAISKAAAAAGIIIKGYIAVDTGMGRIGYSDDVTSVEDVKMIAGLSNFKINGLFSHFATADAADKTYATVQEQRYMSFYKQLLKEGIDIPLRTLGNSAAVMEINSAYYDMVRPGVILYGLYPSDEVDKNQLAIKLAKGVQEKGYKLWIPHQTNQVFVIVDNDKIAQLEKDFFFYTWAPYDETSSVIRLVISWGSTEEDVDAILAAL